ncbi:MAG: hypothetical protein V4858_19920 [Pseudomonadota bacterium]
MPRTHLLIPHLFIGALLAVFVSAAAAASAVPAANNAASLLAKQAEFQTQLQGKTFGEPLHLVSQDSGSRLHADVYAELNAPFATVSTLLGTPDTLCGVLFLHLNVRSCQAKRGANGDVLMLTAGPKQGVTGGTSYNMAYAMHVETSSADYLRVSLAATSGPLSTSDYRIVFEATPLEGERTFLHFGYGYSYGRMAKMALNLYLATAGRNKIGFSVVGKGSDGKPEFVQGERGSVERNVMRNYLALQAYTGVTTGTPQAQMDARLRAWFALTERHPAQLHELTLDEYLAQKREDLAKMATAAR